MSATQDKSRQIIPILLALGVSSGAIFPTFSALLAPFVFPALFLLVTFSLSLATDRPIAILTNPEPSVWGIILWQMAFLPLLVILIGWAIELPPDLHLMVLVTATSSSVFAAPTIAHLFRLNSRLPVAGMVVSTFVMPIALLLFDQALDGEGFPISLSQYATRVSIFLLVPLAASIMINKMVRHLPARNTTTIHGLLRMAAVGSLLVFGIGIMDGVAEKIATDPQRVISFLLLSVGFGLATMIGTICLFWSLGRDLMLAATILSVHRNLGLTYAVIGTAIGQDFAIFVAISQVPMFLSPLAIRLVQVIAFRRPKERPLAQPS